jgi:hypothetical protein
MLEWRGFAVADYAIAIVAVAVVVATWLEWGPIECLVLSVFVATGFAARFVMYARRTGRPAWSPLTLDDLLADRPPRGGLMPPPLFFFSYTRDSTMSKDDETQVMKFYRELESEVRQRSGRLGDCGMWDQELREGSYWNVRLLQALNSCKVLVALCTPGYYDSECCAQEVDFLQLRSSLLPNSGEADAVIKVQWIAGGNPRGTLPFITDRSLDQRRYPGYVKHGLRYVMNEDRAEYGRILHEKAAEIAAKSYEDAYAWDLPSFSATAIAWPKGLAAVYDLANSIKPEAASVAAPVPAQLPGRPYRRITFPVATLLFTLFSARAAIMGWAYYEFREVLQHPELPAPQAIETCQNVHEALVSVHADSRKIGAVDTYMNVLKAETSP